MMKQLTQPYFSFSLPSHKYIGLINQGSTCYLNTLIQSLFMTPEFRKEILKWNYNQTIHPNPDDCIPFQLQKLFALLQHPIRDSEKTEDLTQSFGWSYSDVYVQQDIEELCRVLFDAIQKSMKLENNNDFINQLYLGEYNSVIRCSECENLSLNKDTFLDLNLPISNEFENIQNKSLEMALMNFIKPENLDGNNQYFCSKCNKKVNATKFIKFEKFPQILFLQMGRFSYDIEYDKKIKIYNKVNFPLILNVNQFSKEYKDVIYNPDISENDYDCIKDDIDLIDKYLKDGELVYELFSIMIHSGNETSGHYYAYIKSFEDNKWYNFNDSNVTEISKSSIIEVFGGQTESSLSFSIKENEETAYYLMYRKINKEINYNINDMKLNDTLLQFLEEQKKIHELEEERKREIHNRINLRISCKNDVKIIKTNKYHIIAQLKEQIIQGFNLPPEEHEFKLRVFSDVKNEKMDYIKGNDDDIIDNHLSDYYHYIVQFKENGEYPIFDANLFHFSLYLWETNKDIFTQKQKEGIDDEISKDKQNNSREGETKKLFDLDLKPIKFSCDKDINLINFREKICEVLTIDLDFFETNVLMFHNTSSFVTDVVFALFTNQYDSPFTSLSDIFKFSNNKFLVEYVPDLNLVKSKWIDIIHKYSTHIICEAHYLDERNPYKRTLICQNVNKNKTVSDVFAGFSNYQEFKKHDFFKKTPEGDFPVSENDKLIDIIGDGEVSLQLIGQINEIENNRVKLKIYFCIPNYETFSFYPYQFITIFDEYIVDKTITLREIKQVCINHAKVEHLVDESLLQDNSKIYIRSYANGKPMKIFNESLTIDDTDIESGMELLIHIMDTPLDVINIFPVSPLVISFRFFDTNLYLLSKPVNILFYSSSEYSVLCDSLIRNFPTLESRENVEIIALSSNEEVSLETIFKKEFHKMSEILKQDISSYPLFLKKSGQMCIVKDSRDKIDLETVKAINEAPPIFNEKQENEKKEENKNKSNNETNVPSANKESIKKQIDDENRKRNKETKRVKEKSLVIKVKTGNEESGKMKENEKDEKTNNETKEELKNLREFEESLESIEEAIFEPLI